MKLTIRTKLTDKLRDAVLEMLSTYMKLHLGFIHQFIQSIPHRAGVTSVLPVYLPLIVQIIYFGRKENEKNRQVKDSMKVITYRSAEQS